MHGSTRTTLSISLAITGASGVRVGVETVKALHENNVKLKGIIVTRSAIIVAKHEEDLSPNEFISWLEKYSTVYMEDDFASPLASSSNQPDEMAIVPASMKTIASIAHGYSNNLVSRAALAMLRLGRKLVVAPRETPIGVFELENMLRLAKAGVIIVPFCIGYYTKPRTIDDVTRFLVGKILDALGVENQLYKRWNGNQEI